MKVLLLTQVLPYPPDSGPKVKTWNVLKYLASKHEITLVSFVRGDQKKRSDIDILVEFDRGNIPGLLKFIEMERYLEKLLRKKVDLVRKGGIRPELRKIILKDVVYI